MKKTTIKKILILIGLMGLLANSFVLHVTFLFAYFNNYHIPVAINSIGEANIEAIILIVINSLGIYAVYILVKKEVM